VVRYGAKPVERSAGKFPVLERIEGEQLVHDYNEPKGELVAVLGTFVSQPTLRQECGWPTAQEFKEVQECFGQPPLASLCPPLISGVSPVGETAYDHCINAGPTEIDLQPTPGEDRQHEQSDDNESIQHPERDLLCLNADHEISAVN
jgi:hypothetical protein